MQAPLGRLVQIRHLVGRVVFLVGAELPSVGGYGMQRHLLTLEVEFDHSLRRAHIEQAAHVAMWRRIESLFKVDVTVGMKCWPGTRSPSQGVALAGL